MNVETIIAGGIAAVTAVLIAFIGLVASVHSRMGRLESGHDFLRSDNLETHRRIDAAANLIQEQVRAENQQMRLDCEQLRSESQQTREQLRAENQQMREQMRLDCEQLRSENQQTREEMRLQEERTRELIHSESEQTRVEIRRLADALVSHHHDSDGTTLFRIPPA